jgi:hypothetical protein
VSFADKPRINVSTLKDFAPFESMIKSKSAFDESE